MHLLRDPLYSHSWTNTYSHPFCPHMLSACQCTTLRCSVQYRDLPADTHLSLTLYELSEGCPLLLVGSSSMPMFSKKGRLKTGQQRLQVR